MLRKFAFSALLSTMLCCVITTSNALADGMPIPAPGASTEETVKQPSPKDDSETALLKEIQRIRKGFKDDSSPGDPKERQISYRKDTDVPGSDRVPGMAAGRSDRRNFAVFSRNYINRIHCSGVIEDVLYPTTKGVELELKNSGHDLFLRMGVDVPPSSAIFPWI